MTIKKSIFILMGTIFLGMGTRLFAGPCDLGGSFSMSPVSTSAFKAGTQHTATMTYTVGGSGLATGDIVALKVPEFWSYPNFPSGGTPNYSYPGLVTISTEDASPAIFDVSITSKTIILTVTSGSGAIAGSTISISYSFYTCDINSASTFRMFEAKNNVCSMFSNEKDNKSYPLSAGDGSYLQFPTYEYFAVSNQIAALPLRVMDSCSNMAVATAPIAFNLKAFNSDNTTFDLSSPILSTSSSPFVGGSSIAASISVSTTVFYRSTSTADTRRLEISYTPLGSNYLNNQQIIINNILTGITNVSVDAGGTGSAGTTVSFTPDQDGINDFAFINFVLPIDTSWEVTISSNTDFSSITRKLYGYGRTNRISWDGYTEWALDAQPEVAAPGTYYVKINVNGLTSDTSLSLTLNTGGIKGRVLVGTTPVSNVTVDIFGQSNRFVRTKSDGSFSAYGLRSGSYSYRITKEGYGTTNQSTSLTAGQVLNLGDILLEQATVARVRIFRTTDTVNNQEIWGSVNANTTDWQTNAWGSIHFVANSTSSDAGDVWNSTPTPYTPLSLLPGKVYNFRFDIPNIGVASFSTGPFTAGQVVDINLNGSKKANIIGIVCVPPAYDTTNNNWFSVEAGVDANKDGVYDSYDPSNRYYAGGSFQGGLRCSSFTINGVTNGTYSILTRVPQLIPQTSTNVVVGSGIDAFVDVSTPSMGGNIGGTVTIIGDTTNHPNAYGGFINVPVSAWSPLTYGGAFANVNIATHATTENSTYSLTGLANGTYNLWTSLSGFELDPPGPKTIIVTNGTGNLDLTFRKFNGVLVGSVTAPGADYSNVRIELLPYDFSLQKTSTIPVTNSFFFRDLGTGFYTLRAIYLPTGFVSEKNVQIVNGQTSKVDLNLTGTTFSISGTVRSLASPPYHTLDYLVANGTTNPTSLFNSTASANLDYPANRILARRLLVRDDLANNQSGGTSANTLALNFDPRVMAFGYYIADGSYTIPNLNPGIYLLSNNGEMDGDFTNGNEIAERSFVVSVTTSNISNQDFTLTDGYDVGGRITVDSGVYENGRNMRVVLKAGRGTILVAKNVWLNGTSLSFTMNRVPPGRYVLTAEDMESPKKYAAKDLSIEIVSSSLSNQEIKLLSSAKIQGQLRIKTSGELITTQNDDQLLPDDFYIEARSNPWFQGGWGTVDGGLIDNNNQFTLSLSPGTYDIILRSRGSASQSDAAEGKKSFVPITLSGIRVVAGQTTNLGVIDLREGVSVSGTVTDANGVALANIPVEADNGTHDQDNRLETFTNQLGSYTLLGLDPEGVRFYDIIAAPRPQSDNQQFSNTTATQTFGESRKARFDTSQSPIPFVNFRLQEALGSVSGFVTIPNGSSQPLLLPFDEGKGVNLPGAVVIMNKQGDIPRNNPLGNIEEKTNSDGTFIIKGLTPGIYDMWILALNYGSAIKRDIVVTNTNTSVGTMTVVDGFKMSGTLAKTDGSLLNSQEFDTIIGMAGGFDEIIVGRTNEDASGNITDYAMSGFKSTSTYDILLFGRNDDIITLASAVTLTGDTIQNFVVEDVSPTILTQAKKNPDGSLTIQFELSQAIRNSDTDIDENTIADDSEWDKIIRIKTGTGSLSHDEETWLTSDRKHMTVTYTPVAGETSFVLTASCTFVSINGTTGLNHTKSQDFTYYIGIGKQRTVRIANASGGEADLDEDAASFETQPGTFGNDANLEVSVQFRSADSQTSLASQHPIGSGRAAMAGAKHFGIKAYPSEMAAAIQHLDAMAVDPLSTFYDIFLPAGVSHFFPTGKEARLCLQYDVDRTTDPYSLNIYYFSEAAGEYLLESTNKTVDPDNERICVTIAHASVFTVLASSQSVIAGGGYTGDLKVVNFPNPFNLKTKTITMQDAGAQTLDTEGTMIKISVPTSIAGSGEIEIFNVAGDLVRTLQFTPTSGAHNYTEWDGKNDHGAKVASGVYIGRLTIGGSNEKFFKMAVIK